jgi:hypothetical protein
MTVQSTVQSHIELTETLVRLYVFLTQHLDRTQYESARATYPEQELQSHLASTRAEIMALLAVNRVVKSKVEQECTRVFEIATACATDGPGKLAAIEELKSERDVLKHKTTALSDLLAVFRAA